VYWLIENISQLSRFYESGYKEGFLEIIPYNNTVHPTQNQVSLVYLRPLETTKGYMVCIDHSETMSLKKDWVEKLLQNYNTLYTTDQKAALHYFNLDNLFDITSPPFQFTPPSTPTHDLFYRQHKNRTDLNTIIPAVKHYEICEKIFENLKDELGREKTKYDEFFSRASIVFNLVERSGIKVDKHTFEEYFHDITQDYVYTQYNLKTTTTRPSNKFNGVNYAALNKENGCRNSIIPRNNKLLEIDISAYHPTLASKIVKYTFPTQDIHSHFAEMYGVDYKTAKELTFKQLYGGVFKQYQDLEFFQKVTKYIEEIWGKFNTEGQVKCPVSNYIYKKDKLNDMNPQKLFNYILQNVETSVNILVLEEIFSILSNKKTKMVLYTYDAFLFDVDESEKVIEKIEGIFKKFKLNIKKTEGKNYNFI